MSVRDEPILYLPGTKRAASGTVGGGNAIAVTKVHRLDGAEHAEAEDTTSLDATDSHHGLLPKLSGVATDALRGNGTYGPTPDLVAGTVPASQLPAVEALATTETDMTLVLAPDGAGGLAFRAELVMGVPYYIAAAETFTVPLYRQALFAMTIDVVGTLAVDGYLIEVN